MVNVKDQVQTEWPPSWGSKPVVAEQLAFRPDDHTYWVGKREVPALSRVLASAGVIPPFVGIPEAVLENARVRGAVVHEAIDLFIYGQLDWDSLDEECLPYVDAAAMYLADKGPVILAHEKPTYCERLWVACTPDLVTPDGVVEWKTSSKIADWVGVQLAGQLRILGIDGTRRAIQLKRDGKYREYLFGSPVDFEIFEAAALIQRWRDGGKRGKKHLDESGV